MACTAVAPVPTMPTRLVRASRTARRRCIDAFSLGTYGPAMTGALIHHPFDRPPDIDAAMPIRYPVVIVGAGSVGLTLSLALARQGVRSVVLERSATVGEGSRALGMSRRSMEIWEAMGVAEPMLAIGVPWDSGRSFYRDQTIVEFAMSREPLVRHAPMLNIPQCVVDEFLVAEIELSTMIDIRWQTTLERLESIEGVDGGCAASMTVSTPGGSYDLEADHVVACDGGRSTVRSLLGLRLEGTTFDSNYVIVDIEMDSDHPAERRAWFDPPSNPGSTVLMHRQPGGVWRLDYQLRAGDDLDRSLEPSAVEAKVADHLAMIGETSPWAIKWISSYRANSACLPSFRHGSVLFAGDAAHLIPIFGIRGLNSGVEDSWTLAWKLARVLDGSGGPGLLDSYSDERVAAARENMAAANRSTRVMTPDTIGLILLRDAVLSLATVEPMVQEVLNPRQGLPAAAHGSPLNTPDELCSPGGPTAFVAGPRPGEGLPDISVRCVREDKSETTHLLDLLDPASFTLLIAGDQDPALASIAGSTPSLRLLPVITVGSAGDTSRSVGTHVVDDGRVATLLGAESGAVYLVRPDHLVCARWRNPSPQQVLSALDRACGRPDGPVAASTAPSVGPPLARVERVYQMLADGIDRAQPGAPEHFLAKLALLAGLAMPDDSTLQGLIDTALDEREPPSGAAPQEGTVR